MKPIKRLMFLLLIAALMLGFASTRITTGALARPEATGTSFHFVMAADSRDDYSVLPDLSHKMVTLSPVFGFFAGDLCSTFDTTCINNTWKPALDGNNGNGMLAKTFVSRGNHDNGTLSTWQGLWDFQAMAAQVGATNFSALSSDATYSFDYGNSHFAVVDGPSGGSNTWTSSQVAWLDGDLAAAEGRGIVHEFLISHGPMYTVTSSHGSEVPSAELKAVLNKHPISAGFHGHEHITAYTHVTPGVVSGINDYEQFTMGRAGAPPYSISKAVDWSASQNAFADVAVNGNDFTVTVYSQAGSSLWSKTFTDGAPTAPTSTPTTPLTVPTATPVAGTAVPTSTASSSTATTVTYRSNATYDGQILESSETSTQGGTINATATTFSLGDDSSNRQYRAILSFNTSGLPDNAVITAVMLKIKQAGSAGSNPYSTLGNIMADVRTGPFSGSNSLQSSDFQATPSKSSVMSIGNTTSGGWYTKNMSSTYFSFINKTGVTQFRLRFSTDDNNNRVADLLKFYTGETGTATDRPALLISYTVP